MNSLLMLLAQIDVKSSELGVPTGDLDSGNIKSALKLVFGVAGGVALLIVTVAGFKYVLSQGNPQETVKAKNTIVYALIGLVVCIMAFSIVGFIMGNI